MRTVRLLMGCVIPLVLATGAICQVAVDATGPVRERKREAFTGGGGSTGRKLPLQVTIIIPVLAPDANGKSLVEFVLTNSGNSDIVLPTSPHPGDFEPSDPKLPYTVMRLGLGLSLAKKPAVIFPWGAELYGDRAISGTLTTLVPGASIRILTRVRLSGVTVNSDEPINAIASLDNETVRITAGKLVSDSQNLGFSTSKPYTFSALFKVDP